MRISRLDLVRYGKFTDFSLEFGPAPDHGVDFHLVFGPNEAGKSTTFNAYLDLLYGIANQTSYAFLHDYKDMRIGAVLEADGRCLALSRIKGRSNDLLDGDGQPADPAQLAALLHGVDRTSYEKMLSLDDDTLVKGGEEILASQGDVGRLLFSATAGVSEFSARLEALRQEADGFYKPRARTAVLNKLLADLKELKKERADLDMAAGDFDRLRKAREAADTRYAEARRHCDGLRAQAEDLHNLKRAFAVQDRLAREQARLAPLRDFPDVPEDWADEARRLIGEQEQGRSALKAARDDLDRLRAARDVIRLDPQILDQAARIESLREAQTRFAHATAELPGLETEATALSEAIERICARLGAPVGTAPRTLLVPDADLEALDRLSKDYGGIFQAQATAGQEHAKAKRQLRAAQAALPEAPEGLPEAAQVATATLETLVKRLRQGETGAQVRHAEAALREARDQLEAALGALAPWRGTAEDLARRPVPSPETARRWRDGALALREQRREAEERIARHRAEADRLTVTIEALNRSGDVVSDEEAHSVRQRRNAAWKAHRDALTRVTADIFEDLLQEDDRVRDLRFAAGARLAELRQAEASKADHVAAGEAGERDCAAVAAREAEDAAARAGALEAAGLPATYSAEDLPSWLEAHARARAAGEGGRDRARALAAAEATQTEHAEALGSALSACGQKIDPDQPLEHLLTLADTVVEDRRTRERALESAAQAVERARQEVAARAGADRDAQEAWEAWTTRWTRHVAAAWFADQDPERVMDHLPLMRELGAALERLEGLIAKRKARLGDRDIFSSVMAQVAGDLGCPPGDDPGAAFEVLTARLAEARQAEERFAERVSEIAGAEERERDALRRLEGAKARIAEMAARFPDAPVQGRPIESAADLQIAIEQGRERRRILDKSAEDESELLAALGTATVEEAQGRLAGVDRESLEDRLRQAEADLQHADEELGALRDERRDAHRAIEDVGGDDAAARIEERRRTLLLDIGAQAERALRLRLGIMAAERSLHLYRDRHRSTMLRETAQAFAAMTHDAFGTLTTQPSEGAGEALVAIRAGDGRSIRAQDMSKGTRFQLYLALRLAGYRQFCQSAGPLPFVADDIMETFDDERAGEALKLMSEIGRLGQAIYFTHHAHLCDIAESVCGERVRVHRPAWP